MDFVRVGYFIPLNGPLNGHPPSNNNNSRLHYHHSFISTSQPLLCEPAEARIAKWQEHWGGWLPRATKRNTTSTQKNDSRVVTQCRRVTTECARDRPPPRERNIYRSRNNCMCGVDSWDPDDIMTSCGHLEERPKRDEIVRCGGCPPLQIRHVVCILDRAPVNRSYLPNTVGTHMQLIILRQIGVNEAAKLQKQCPVWGSNPIPYIPESNTLTTRPQPLPIL